MLPRLALLLIPLLLAVAGCDRPDDRAAPAGPPAPTSGAPASGDTPPADGGTDTEVATDHGQREGDGLPPCPAGEAAWLVGVVDGDTIDVAMEDGSLERVRYIGMDTPERGQPCFTEATQANGALLQGDRPPSDGGAVNGVDVTLARDVSERDRYHRLLRYVCNAGGDFVNARLVAEGYARPLRYPPDVRYAEDFKALYAAAMQARRGCLGQLPDADSDPAGTGCCRVCRNGQACGDSCIGWGQTCSKPPGCACQG